ncbi:hypothetical protein PR202_ga18151 [Eleusine coracana subsp. coracana]|uniref:Uncharacterized protein n=1 Tax=Eleusine coracana subsp. coracana TaxID=191504 RepID=A0AAV5CRB2_ELECO|nr:hypothetical protein PR202_ga18151 [Eleusine coracana subsp. coracana]
MRGQLDPGHARPGTFIRAACCKPEGSHGDGGRGHRMRVPHGLNTGRRHRRVKTVCEFPRRNEINSAIAIYNSWGNAGSVAFVLAADAAILLLFLCLREFERAGREREKNIKVAVWLLTTMLTLMFASRVAPLMPPVVSMVAWAMSVATAAGGFWALFLSP